MPSKWETSADLRAHVATGDNYEHVFVEPGVLARHPELLALCLALGRELEKRRRHPFYVYKADSHERGNQLAFHQSPKRIRLVFGGNQSGKSRCAAQEVGWWLCENHPYLETPKAPRVYVVSAKYMTVQEGVYKHLKAILPLWEIEGVGQRIAGTVIPKWIQMRKGGRVDFLTAEGGEDARRTLAAAEVDLACLDEEVDVLIWEEIQARRLARNGKVIVSATLHRSEPWCLDLENQAEAGSELVDMVRLSTYRARDRGHVSKDQLAEMEALLTEEQRLVRLEGKSRRYEGLVYPSFTTDKHVVKPFHIPPDWTRYCALDPGWRTFGILWVAVAPDTKCYVYREIYTGGKHYSAIADAIHAAEGYRQEPKTKVWHEVGETEKIHIRWIDPSQFGFHESGEVRVGNLLAQHPYNLYCAPAQNDIEAGIESVSRLFMPGLDEIPRLRVFSTCVSFLKEIRGYRRQRDTAPGSKNATRDVPVKRNDHLMDCMRYLALPGLEYVAPVDPRFRPPTEEEVACPFKVASRLDQVVADEWASLMRRGGEVSESAPLGGIGSEY